MEALKRLRKMITEGIEELAEKGSLSVGDLDAVDKLTHSLKSIDAVMGGGYSQDYKRMDRRYSRDTERHIDRLRSMLAEASDEKEKKALRKCIDDMER